MNVYETSYYTSFQQFRRKHKIKFNINASIAFNWQMANTLVVCWCVQPDETPENYHYS
jgi:hypothetical protein